MTPPATRRGLPAEAWQVPGQPTAWTAIRDQIAAHRRTELAHWQRLADERNAAMAQYYTTITERTGA